MSRRLNRFIELRRGSRDAFESREARSTLCVERSSACSNALSSVESWCECWLPMMVVALRPICCAGDLRWRVRPLSGNIKGRVRSRGCNVSLMRRVS